MTATIPVVEIPIEFRLSSEIDPKTASVGKMFWECRVSVEPQHAPKIMFLYRVADIANRFDMTVAEVGRVQQTAGHIIIPPTKCKTGGSHIEYDPWVFKSRTDFQDFIRGQWSESLCHTCRAALAEANRIQREEIRRRQEEAALLWQSQAAERKEKLRKKYGIRCLGDCPEQNCEGILVARKGRNNGLFIGCSSFPQCQHTQPIPKPIEVSESDFAEILEARKLMAAAPKCPECGQPLRKIPKGKYGPFIGCSGYPKCRYTEVIPVPQAEQQPAIASTENGGQFC
jgi:ssDNA-binding Zn-finger/Zn-ribbon topoisomerase 1